MMAFSSLFHKYTIGLSGLPLSSFLASLKSMLVLDIGDDIGHHFKQDCHQSSHQTSNQRGLTTISRDDRRATVLVARHRMMTMAMALLYHSISPLAALLILPIASSPMPSPSEIIHLVLLRIQPSAIERTSLY